MAEYPILRNAPITEALIDFRIKIKEGFDVAQIEALHDVLSGQYPGKKTRHRLEGRFEFKKGEKPVSLSTEAVDGYIFTSADQKQVFQARIDGFTFNRLKPYDKWETFRNEAKRLWEFCPKVSAGRENIRPILTADLQAMRGLNFQITLGLELQSIAMPIYSK